MHDEAIQKISSREKPETPNMTYDDDTISHNIPALLVRQLDLD